MWILCPALGGKLFPMIVRGYWQFWRITDIIEGWPTDLYVSNAVDKNMSHRCTWGNSSPKSSQWIPHLVQYSTLWEGIFAVATDDPVQQ